MSSHPNSLDQFCINFASKRLQWYHWTVDPTKTLRISPQDQSEGIVDYALQVIYFDNIECIRLLQSEHIVKTIADKMVGEQSPFGKDDATAQKPGGYIAGNFRVTLTGLIHALNDQLSIYHDQASGSSIPVIDLIATLIQPIAIVYLVYLIFNVARGDQAASSQLLVVLAIIYSLQALVFMLRTFAFIVPLYSSLLPEVLFWPLDEP
ncbi:hypothetical protein PM082_018117 [Marasmius tenuissimus]|nr:hypothetical protein PM082_018117 [Marasmius tenuissimus]